jgi:hypothetical protein
MRVPALNCEPMAQMDTPEDRGFRATYGVECLYKQSPPLEKKVLLESLKRRVPSARPLDSNAAEHLLAFIYPDHVVSCSDGDVPAQTLVVVAEQMPASEVIEAALQQSWAFPEARQIVRVHRIGSGN